MPTNLLDVSFLPYLGWGAHLGIFSNKIHLVPQNLFFSYLVLFLGACFGLLFWLNIFIIFTLLKLFIFYFRSLSHLFLIFSIEHIFTLFFNRETGSVVLFVHEVFYGRALFFIFQSLCRWLVGGSCSRSLLVRRGHRGPFLLTIVRLGDRCSFYQPSGS